VPKIKRFREWLLAEMAAAHAEAPGLLSGEDAPTLRVA